MELVRAYLDAFLAGDLATAQGMVAPDFAYHLVDTHGRHVTIRGFDAVRAYVHERSESLGITLRYELLEFLADEDQVVAVFEEDAPLVTSSASRQLALWSFQGDRIASVRIHGVPAVPGDAAASPTD